VTVTFDVDEHNTGPKTVLKYLKIAYLTKHMELRSKTTCLSKNNFFFLISNFKFNKKAQRGATLIHGKYTRVPLYGRNN
jgi:hypothetical protein